MIRTTASLAVLVLLAGCSDQQTILDGLNSQDEQTRERAIWTVASRGSQARWAVPTLIESLAEPETRVVVAWALAEIGPDAAEAGEALLALLLGEGPQVRASAAWALARIGRRDETTRRAIEALRDDSDVLARQTAEAALRYLSAS